MLNNNGNFKQLPLQSNYVILEEFHLHLARCQFNFEQVLTNYSFTSQNSLYEQESTCVQIIINLKLDSRAQFNWYDQGLSTTILNLYASLQDHLKALLKLIQLFTIEFFHYLKHNTYNSFFVEIQNLINPNTEENYNTSEFRNGIRQSGRYTYYNGNLVVLEMITLPGQLYLINMTLLYAYQKVQSYFTALYPIPNGGSLLIMAISTENAQYDTYDIEADQVMALPSKQSFNQKLIQKLSDCLIFYFIDNSLYTLPSQQIVRYSDATNLQPKLTKFSVENIKEYSATMQIEINQIKFFCNFQINFLQSNFSITVAEAYYMYCLNRITKPSISYLLSLGHPHYKSSLSKNGYLNILAKSSIPLNLYVQTDYAFYIGLKNQEGIASDQFILNFSTKNRSKISFIHFSANQAQIVTIMNYIVFILSLPSWKIVINVYHIIQ
ncbi:unnamed protein product [Paramecium sonneborni]|uniref:Uncharacterized protein n=1 Tax=Paramecium sonneborni TaxID=65129 RepID=A0A8S1QNP4_9CILI|nr:unnamed protein product [Paramecium sonneborni]